MKFGRALGVAVPKSASLLEALIQVITEKLAIPTEKAMNFIMHRLAGERLEDTGAAVLEIDEATGVVERDGAELIKEAQKKEKGVLIERERESFQAEYRKKRRDLYELALEIEKQGPKRKKKEHVPKMATTFSQKSAKQYLPEGASIWRGLTSGVWCAHLPPFRRVSCRWTDVGEVQAMKIVIKLVWKQRILGWGLPDYPEGCPFSEYLESSAASSSS